MDKSKGRVRNILVSNLDSFKELLIRGLIRHNISYVMIDNEVHCFDKIFRFYDVKDACNLIDEGVLIFGREDEKIRLLSDMDLIFAKKEQEFKDTLLNFGVEDVSCEEVSYSKKKQGIPSYNKRQIKRDNHMLNQKLKRNKR